MLKTHQLIRKNWYWGATVAQDVDSVKTISDGIKTLFETVADVTQSAEHVGEGRLRADRRSVGFEVDSETSVCPNCPAEPGHLTHSGPDSGSRI